MIFKNHTKILSLKNYSDLKVQNKKGHFAKSSQQEDAEAFLNRSWASCLGRCEAR